MSGVEVKLGQSLDDLIKSQKTAAKKTAAASKVRLATFLFREIPRLTCFVLDRPHRTQKKKTPSKGVKPAPKSKPKAGKKATTSTPNSQKGVAIKVKKTPVSIKGGVKKGKSKAMPMAIDGNPASAGTGGRRARRVSSGGTTKVILVGENAKAAKKDARNHMKVRGEAGGSINARFEKISRERSTKGSRAAPGKGTTNKFGVYMPF